MFDKLYETINADKIKSLGKLYKPPKKFTSNKPMLVAKLKYDGDGDGHDVEVYETRLPARFFQIKALPTKRFNGFSLSTGSGMGEEAGKIAKLIAEGMLGITRFK